MCPKQGHYCAISRHFYCSSIYKNCNTNYKNCSSNYKNGLRKNPSPFIYSRGMPINTGVPRLIGLFYPFITLHLFAIFRFRQTDRAWLMRLLRPVQGVYYDQVWSSIKTKPSSLLSPG